jgi:hypothetical protein
MAFEGGQIPVVGMSGQQLVQQLTGSALQSVPLGYGPYGGLAAGGAEVLLNVGISSVLGQEVAGGSGFDLSSGTTFLASQVTPFLSSTVSNLVSNEISGSLRSLGPLGNTLGDLGGRLATSAATSVVNGLFGTSIGGGLGSLFGGAGRNPANAGGPTRAFPGAGAEPTANYGGSVYNLGPGGPDVVFTIRGAASSTPQNFGLSEVFSGRNTSTSMALNQVSNAAFSTNLLVNNIKAYDMVPTSGLTDQTTIAYGSGSLI